MTNLLLLSGGMDSSAIAAWRRPEACLFIDYGQRPASGERRSAEAVSDALGVRLESVTADCSAVGAGTLAGSREKVEASPSPEWWPFRNQLLVTLAAAVAVRTGGATVLIGTVREDAARHADGTPGFIESLDGLLAQQEGGVRLSAPALHLTSAELIEQSGVTDEVLAWTHSCHLASVACGGCNGCRRRRDVLDRLGRLV